MLRTVAAVEQRPWLLLGLVFIATCIFGFLIQAGGSVYLQLRADPIAFQYRTTLSYTSAIVGDGILIPLANVLITSQLVTWRRRPHVAEIGGAMLLGALVTAFVHLFQAANDRLEWAMTAPYRLTGLGYGHGAVLFAELSAGVWLWGQVALVGV